MWIWLGKIACNDFAFVRIKGRHGALVMVPNDIYVTTHIQIVVKDSAQTLSARQFR